MKFTWAKLSLTVKSHFHLKIAPWDASLRSKRAECYEVMGELYKAVTDIK